ncbi:hypothetical protein CGGC5_v002603 [Colletotrichum fructicola Nara gc5]|uniref:Uncharacterized protein n=1 Tax=Colletotrichum fructicola (strain Nara gc5) TaxID=1213859 RepID=A0A7J6JP55_COLFN|nr:hypothetical protein CGGC5_v002603 [Colletotrichum fructicola Nara gc5]
MSRQLRSTPKVQWQSNKDGSRNAFISASQVSSSQLKEYLDSNYPGGYSVQLKHINGTNDLTPSKEHLNVPVFQH